MNCTDPTFQTDYFVRGRDSLREYITSLFTSQIAIYDGAMGTMIQNYSKRNKLEEEEYRGDKFKDWSCNVKGNNDMLSITQPHVIQGIYRQYLEEGGSNLIGTNTFSSTTIAMSDARHRLGPETNTPATAVVMSKITTIVMLDARPS